MKTDSYLRKILDNAAEDGYILDTVIASPIEKATFVSQLAKELFMTDWSLDCVDVIERAQAAVTSASTLWDGADKGVRQMTNREARQLATETREQVKEARWDILYNFDHETSYPEKLQKVDKLHRLVRLATCYDIAALLNIDELPLVGELLNQAIKAAGGQHEAKT